MSLFEELAGAQFSTCGQYRYTLWRTWDPEKPVATFIMLNPSTADEMANDPTVERCQRRSHEWGYGGLRVANIFAYRSTDPGQLYEVKDPIGPENDQAILEMAAGAGIVVCGWGVHGGLRDRGRLVAHLLLAQGVTLHCLRQVADGQPGHPLYIGYEVVPVPVDLAALGISTAP